MADHDEPVEETVMLTRRAHRSRRTAAASIDQPAVEGRDRGQDQDRSPDAADDGVDEHTIAVPRDREDPVDDRTVAVARRSAGGGSGRPSTQEDLDDLDDRTAVVDRTAAATVSIPASVEAVEDHTVVVDRAVRPPVPGWLTDDADDLDVTIPAAPARRVETEPLPAIYKPRPAPLRPSRPPAVEGGVAPTRVLDDGATSVSRAARRTSVRVLAAVAGACAVSVCGLVALAFVVFS